MGQEESSSAGGAAAAATTPPELPAQQQQTAVATAVGTITRTMHEKMQDCLDAVRAMQMKQNVTAQPVPVPAVSTSKKNKSIAANTNTNTNTSPEAAETAAETTSTPKAATKAQPTSASASASASASTVTVPSPESSATGTKATIATTKEATTTPGAIPAISRMSGHAQDPSFQPIVIQVIHIKTVGTFGGNDRYRVVLSDGTHYVQGMLSLKLNHLVTDKSLISNALIRLEEFVNINSQGQTVILVNKMTILENLKERIGTPSPETGIVAIAISTVEAESTSTTVTTAPLLLQSVEQKQKRATPTTTYVQPKYWEAVALLKAVNDAAPAHKSTLCSKTPTTSTTPTLTATVNDEKATKVSPETATAETTISTATSAAAAPLTSDAGNITAADKSSGHGGGTSTSTSATSTCSESSAPLASNSSSSSSSSSSNSDEKIVVLNSSKREIHQISGGDGGGTEELETDELETDESSSPLVSNVNGNGNGNGNGSIYVNGNGSIHVNGSSSIRCKKIRINSKIKKISGATKDFETDEHDKEYDDGDDSSSSSEASIPQEPEDTLPDQGMTLEEAERQDEESVKASPEPWSELAAWGRSLDETAKDIKTMQAMQTAEMQPAETSSARALAAAEAFRMAQAAQAEEEAKVMVEAALAEQLVAAAARSKGISILSTIDDSSDDGDDILLKAHPMLSPSLAKKTSFKMAQAPQARADAKGVAKAALAAQLVPAAAAATSSASTSPDSTDDENDDSLLKLHPIPSPSPAKETPIPRREVVDLTLSSDDDDDDDDDDENNNDNGDEMNPIASTMHNSAGAKVDLTQSYDDDDNNGDVEMNPGGSTMNNSAGAKVDLTQSSDDSNGDAEMNPIGSTIDNSSDNDDDEDDDNTDSDEMDHEMDHIGNIDSSAGATNSYSEEEKDSEQYSEDEKYSEQHVDAGPPRRSGDKNRNRCSICPGCRKPDCGKCSKCALMAKNGGKGSRGACILRPCVRFVKVGQNLPHQKHSRDTMGYKEEYPTPDQARSQATRTFKEEVPYQSQTRSQVASLRKEKEDDSDHSDGSIAQAALSTELRIAQAALSSELRVGSRCYSKFINGQWYWGAITKVSGKEKYARYAVDYDDGDTLSGIPWTDICSVKQYKEDFNEPPRPKSRSRKRQKTTVGKNLSKENSGLSLLDLRRRRCRKCVMCTKKDCGMCISCQSDKGDTSIHKQVCLLKMCDNISTAEKAQPVPGLENFKFYFTDPTKLPAVWRTRALHPAVEGLRVISPNGLREYRGVETAVKACKMSPDKSDAIAKAFYEEHIGISVRLEIEHPLVGKGYFRVWNDMLGRPQEICGRIEECQQDYFDRDLSHFTVKYDDASRNQLLTNGSSIPATDGSISEKEAWGGCMLYDFKVSEMNQLPRSLKKAYTPFHTNWIIPSSRTESHVVFDDPAAPVGSFTMNVRGFTLEFIAKKSQIPNSGLGVFVKASKSPLMTKPVDYFELEPGDQVDLGIYAPLRPQDRLDDAVNLLKNFIHKFEPEGWAFNQAARHEGKASNVFDITDDWTGDLHSLASQNVMVYVNETDGKNSSIPTVWAAHDPAGAVHYLMGHGEKKHGNFRIPLNGDEIELKIDYGEKYEKVRVQKGYPRGTKAEIAKLKTRIENDDSDVVRALRMYSAKEVDDCIAFLEGIFTLERVIMDGDTDKIARSIVAAVLLLSRLKTILIAFEGLEDDASFCDNGYTSLEKKHTLERARQLVTRLCGLWQEEQLKAVLVSKELYCIVLVPALNCASPEELSRLSSFDFRTRINQMCQPD